ncbi:DUF551 domain-containing protein [Escherichia albertii]|uniref:DUF551 domain-containing protein n=1 Tax=Escherichia albertii TaxID=208962 RepID=A0ABX5HAF8_ESCAL|nr:DUF551 domain-containing protein [Escherichia albertii]PSY36313.1 DUF551 domain-containing protein [Escherichia albertii]
MAELTREQLIEEAKLKIAIAECHPNPGMAQVESELFKIALASLEAEPVAYIFKHPAGKLFWSLTDESNKGQSDVMPVYAALPVPVVPEEMDLLTCHLDGVTETYTGGWNACRAAMLKAGNYPVTPDSWISCSVRMPEKHQNVLISVNFDSSLVEPLICSARYTGSTFRRGDATIKLGNGIEQATHWMPLPEPPQEVNQ